MISTEQLLQLDLGLFDRVVAIVTDKGGVGKTSVVTQCGGLLAAADNRVLIVDLDPQANTMEDLGILESDDGANLFQAIASGQPLEPLRKVRPNLDIVTAGLQATRDLETFLLGRRGRQNARETLTVLRRALAPIIEDYDFVFIDTNPGIEILHDLALATARYGIIPARSDASSRKAMRQIANRYNVAREVNPDLELLGVVLFGSDQRATTTRADALAKIGDDLGDASDLVFHTVIRFAEKAHNEARNSGRLVHEMEHIKDNQKPWYQLMAERKAGITTERPVARSMEGLAEDYQNLTQEIVARITEREAA